MKITAQSAKEIRDDVLSALNDVATKHGVQFTYKGGNFTSTSFLFKIEAATIEDNGTVVNRERENYGLYCHRYGLKPEWLDRTFISFGSSDMFTIIGINPRKHVNPVICRNERTKKNYVFPATAIKTFMV